MDVKGIPTTLISPSGIIDFTTSSVGASRSIVQPARLGNMHSFSIHAERRSTQPGCRRLANLEIFTTSMESIILKTSIAPSNATAMQPSFFKDGIRGDQVVSTASQSYCSFDMKMSTIPPIWAMKSGIIERLWRCI
ncbi:hypothetical protein FRB94_005409 [Tulasnella sp. JGI-2019a]|nr:hypothetical protein FRB93_008127 [Tulasnella sp. JGI-2019a]KAG9000439.1 hypothetical protein FRB94_005409 [Tulasnella sp. JGI-2019a]KAG9028501.1 hypothetical protein FRB95_006402 [Tulasnella sp. JGI-2019a]